MKKAQLEQIIKHGENLNAIFNTGLEPLVLCKKLRRLENKAHKLALDYCNGENGVNTENWEIKQAPILAAVRKILFSKGFDNSPLQWSIFINGDARGYALKIKDSVVRNRNLNIYCDMGGYGILAPDLTNL